MWFQNVDNIKKYFLLFIVIVFLWSPFVVYGYYIIDDIPNIGDDGLRPKDDINNGQAKQVVKEVTTDVTITETTKTIVTTTITKYKTPVQFISAVGVMTGASMAIAGTTVPFFATTPTMIQDLLFLNFFGLFLRRKNKKRWGVVFDIDTKRPVPAVKVTLFDSQMKELETTYSDKEGRFGFLAKEGVYRLDAYKNNYESVMQKYEDEVYGTLYAGDEISVLDNEVLRVNIALRSTTINWKQYANKKVIAYTSTWSLVKKYLFTTLYCIGFIATIIITFFYPSIFNIILIIINVVFFVVVYFIKKKDHGNVMLDNKKPVPFAVVNLYNKEGKKEAFAVTDVIGRYYMLVNNGQYMLKASGQSMGEMTRQRQYEVNINDGFMNKDIILK